MHRRDFLLGSLAPILQNERLAAAVALIERATASGDVSAAVLDVRQASFTLSRGFGLAKDPDAIFLLASISKPMTASGLMILVDRGEVALSDPVRKFIPEFTGGDRDLVTLRHLLTHTSGLPDMLPENVELRKRFAPLSEFVARTCETPLLFKPGAQVRYQSMGILLASEIAQRITGTPFREFLRKELFLPLGMKRTSLGLGGREIPHQTRVQTTDEPWGWNSQYWRELGSPWGTAHSTAPEVAVFLRSFAKPDGRVLKVATARAMVTNQTPDFKQNFGLGWMMTPGTFGRNCSDQTFGHSGSTGTTCWMDPERDLSFVLLTTKPAAESGKTLLRPVSDGISQGVNR